MPGSGRPFAGPRVPWYREPWPWLIMAGPLVVVIASFFTVWLAVKSDDGVVAGDYYKRGLLVNLRLPKAAAPAQRVDTYLGFMGDEMVVVPVGSDITADTLRVTLVHPASGIRQQVMLMRDGDGGYSGVVPPGPSGAWIVAFTSPRLPTTVVDRR
jgi:hypothetical protein